MGGFRGSQASRLTGELSTFRSWPSRGLHLPREAVRYQVATRQVPLYTCESRHNPLKRGPLSKKSQNNSHSAIYLEHFLNVQQTEDLPGVDYTGASVLQAWALRPGVAG